MPVIAVVGNQGDGKTLSVVREAIIDYNNGLKIYSNIELIGIKYQRLNISLMREYLSDKRGITDVVIIIDEAHLVADSRDFRKEMNKLLGYFALQTRKRNVKLYLITQYLENIDKRLRRCAFGDIIISCEGIYEGKRSDNKLVAIQQIILYHGQLLKRKIRNPEKFFKFFKTGEVLPILDE